MTDPKKLLKSKLQNRLHQQSAQSAQPTVATPEAALTADKRPPAKKASSGKVTNAPGVLLSKPAEKTSHKLPEKPSVIQPAAQPGAHSASQKPQPSPTGETNSLTQHLEALISKQNQPEPPPDFPESATAVAQNPHPESEVKWNHRKQKPRREGVKKVRTPMSPERKHYLLRLILLYSLAAIIVLLDQLSKNMAHSMLMDASQRVTSWFDLILVFNPGAAFSLFADSSWQRPFLVGVSLLVSIALIIWLPRTEPHKLVLPLGLACILGGAVGNLIDRALYGYVIDFISVHYQELRFPTFNLADSMITVGAGLLILDMLVGNRTNREAGSMDKTHHRQEFFPAGRQAHPYADASPDAGQWRQDAAGPGKQA